MTKILIIDDDEAISSIYQTTFQKAGFEVVAAYDGQSGVEKAKAEHPNLILLDQVMPDIKGTDVLKILRSDPGTQSIPVALLSNFGQAEIVKDAISQGAIDYILKYQIEPQDLVGKVKRILQEVQASAGSPSNAGTSTNNPTQ